MPKLVSVVASISAALALSASSVTLAQERAFIEATTEHLTEATETCEAAKAGRAFDTAKIIQQGWRNRGGPSMFGKLPSGASITISDSKHGKNDSCIIIGWVNKESSVDDATSRIASTLGLMLENDPSGSTTAQHNGWDYAFLRFTKPEVTDQIRMIIVVSASKSN